jgi:hypothetical protein
MKVITSFILDKYFIETVAEKSDMKAQLWLIVRSLKMQAPPTEYILSQNDTIRLGQAIFHVTLMNDRTWLYNTALSSSFSYSNLL